METETERTVRQKLLCRIIVQWAVFLGLFAVTAVTFEFLYGPPQRPSLDFARQAFGRHGMLFAAFFALAPIAIRDSLKGAMKVVAPYLKQTQQEQTQQGTSSVLSPPSLDASDDAVAKQVQELRETVATPFRGDGDKTPQDKPGDSQQGNQPVEQLVAT